MSKVKKICIAALIVLSVVGSIYILQARKNHLARVVFISDTHATVDAKDRDLQWNTNSFVRIKQIFSAQGPQPTHLIWLGDIIDFVPTEWDIVKSWVSWISQNHASVKQYAVMGNHDYLYYNYPEIQGRFYSIRPELETMLKAPVKYGDRKLRVADASKFIEKEQILLIEAPDRDTSNRSYIGTVKHLDKKRNIVELSNPLTTSFAAASTAIRQGYTEARGISKFLSTFSGTQTRSTRSVFIVGNVCFVMLSMDNYFNFDLRTLKTTGISEEDFQWFEKQLATYHQTHNIIVATHELPNSGKFLGGLHDPGDSTDFNNSTRIRFARLIERYKISAWISGHTHPDARKDKVNSDYMSTHFLLVPSLGMGIEGQTLTLELHEGDDALKFQYWSTDKKAFFYEVDVPIKHKINLTDL